MTRRVLLLLAAILVLLLVISREIDRERAAVGARMLDDSIVAARVHARYVALVRAGVSDEDAMVTAMKEAGR